MNASDLVVHFATEKAREVAQRAGVPRHGIVLGADTAVVLDGHVFGKPVDAVQARAMIARLSGREHIVMTAIALFDGGGEAIHVETTKVRFRALSAAEADWYVGTGEWRERAGGYAIQGAGAAIVESVNGDYTAVVGLPVPALSRLLLERGFFPPISSA